jgi:hypothetical protein
MLQDPVESAGPGVVHYLSLSAVETCPLLLTSIISQSAAAKESLHLFQNRLWWPLVEGSFKSLTN